MTTPDTPPRTVELGPAESIALTVALEQLRRGEQPSWNVAAACIYALADRVVVAARAEDSDA